jgi:CubicO group peptidase (beta-lactamase class C family)
MRSASPPYEQRRTLAESVLRKPPLERSRFLYSNVGYALAGAIAERAAELDYEALLRRELFEPLGMASAGFGPPSAEGGAIAGHTGRGEPLIPGETPLALDNPPAIAPAGRAHATLADWGKYASLHLSAARGAPRHLSAESYARLHARAGDDDARYALGWGVHERDWARGRVLAHAGSNTYWYATIWIAPERDRAFLAACNQGGAAAQKACDEAIVELSAFDLARARR